MGVLTGPQIWDHIYWEYINKVLPCKTEVNYATLKRNVSVAPIGLQLKQGTGWASPLFTRPIKRVKEISAYYVNVVEGGKIWGTDPMVWAKKGSVIACPGFSSLLHLKSGAKMVSLKIMYLVVKAFCFAWKYSGVPARYAMMLKLTLGALLTIFQCY